MKFHILQISSALMLLTSPAYAWQGFVNITQEKQIYVDYLAAQNGKPTVVLLNGLTYDAKRWDSMIPGLAVGGHGVLRYDATGQGQTLLKYAPITEIIKIEDQARELGLLLGKLRVSPPIYLAGLSYGGGLAMEFAALYPNHVAGVVLMAPYVAPIPAQDQLIKSQVRTARIDFPGNPATDDELYDYFLRQMVYTVFPLTEPDILENPFKPEAVFRMAQGIRKLIVTRLIPRLPPVRIHLMVAGNDQYIPHSMHDLLWNSLPSQKKMSRINVKFSEHKMAEAVPHFAAGWISHIMDQDQRISSGLTFDGDPHAGTARSGNISVALPKN